MSADSQTLLYILHCTEKTVQHKLWSSCSIGDIAHFVQLVKEPLANASWGKQHHVAVSQYPLLGAKHCQFASSQARCLLRTQAAERDCKMCR